MSLSINKKSINNHILLLILAVLFILLYSVLAQGKGFVFNSPDENANYFFTKLFAETGGLSYKLPVDSDVLHPRSMTVVTTITTPYPLLEKEGTNGAIISSNAPQEFDSEASESGSDRLVPQSFLGLPIIYGLLAKVFGTKAILFFTPIIAVISVLFFYKIIKKVFDEKVAFLSALLVFIHPAFWYYATHSMYHNVLFVSFFIIGLYFLVDHESVRHPIGCRTPGVILEYFAAFLFIGLALTVRYTEAAWVLPILIIFYFLNRRHKGVRHPIGCRTPYGHWLYLAISLVVSLVVALPILFFNKQLYGRPFLTGYDSGKTLVVSQNSAETQSNIFIDIARSFWNYGVYLFWWISVPAYFGLVYLLKNIKKITKSQKNYLIMFLFGFVCLVATYGSWVFHDNPDPSKITIGTSYVRYWLTIYIFSMPFLAIALIKLKDKISGKYRAVSLVVLALLVSYNFLFVFTLTDESLSNNILSDYPQIKSKVLNATEDNAIIIASYYDKLFFPERLVIENLDEERDKRLTEINKLLAKNYPIYYYSWQSDADINYLNENVLGEYRLKLRDPVVIKSGERLFKLVKI